MIFQKLTIEWWLSVLSRIIVQMYLGAVSGAYDFTALRLSTPSQAGKVDFIGGESGVKKEQEATLSDSEEGGR
jgi:uncharacterized protein (UPF0262 family)